MKRPKISVIVPVYNAGNRLSKCIDALIGQTFKEIEIICVNDGSTDGSTDIIKHYQTMDSRVKIVDNQENSGVSIARNRGIDHARSPYIMFCDSDDYYDRSMCEKLYDAIIADGSDAAVCGAKNIYTTQYGARSEIDEYFRVKFSGLKDITANLILENDVSPCNKIFRKEIMERYEIRFPEGLRYEDNFFFIAYASASSTISFVDEYLYNYVRHGNSFMDNQSKHSMDKFTIALRLYDFLERNSFIESRRELFWRFFIMSYNFSWQNLGGSSNQRKLKKIARSFIVEHKLQLRKLPCKVLFQIKVLTSPVNGLLRKLYKIK